MDLFYGTVAFATGAIIGSFLNVVIHRYPREESVVWPASRCPSCGTPIRPYDNVPVLSWFVLGGRCRSCRAPIALRYPLIELANALFFLAVYLHLGLTVGTVLVSAIASMTIVLIFIDAEIQILPDVIDLPGIALGLLIGFLQLGALPVPLVLSTSAVDSVIGAVAGGGVLLFISWTYKLLRRIEGMGLGDVKMLAMIGAVTGWRALLPVVFIASVTGAAFGLAIAARKRTGLQFALPFGVFLGFALLIVIFFGVYLEEWYFAVMTF